MSELIPINILIADRSYRIRTKPTDEEIIRKTVKMINDKITEFKTQFAGKDMQDYISMVIIWYATQNAGGEGNSMAKDEIIGMIARMSQEVDNALEVKVAPVSK